MRLEPAEKAIIVKKAQDAWDKADKNQRTGIRFGMFDVAMIKAAGFNPNSKDRGEQDQQHAFTCALMDCASTNGGMRA